MLFQKRRFLVLVEISALPIDIPVLCIAYHVALTPRACKCITNAASDGFDFLMRGDAGLDCHRGFQAAYRTASPQHTSCFIFRHDEYRAASHARRALHCTPISIFFRRTFAPSHGDVSDERGAAAAFLRPLLPTARVVDEARRDRMAPPAGRASKHARHCRPATSLARRRLRHAAAVDDDAMPICPLSHKGRQRFSAFSSQPYSPHGDVVGGRA